MRHGTCTYCKNSAAKPFGTRSVLGTLTTFMRVFVEFIVMNNIEMVCVDGTRYGQGFNAARAMLKKRLCC